MVIHGLNIVPEYGYYVKVRALDGDLHNIHAIDSSQDGGASWSGISSGKPVHTENFPTKMQWLDEQGHSIPDFDMGLAINVSERANYGDSALNY